MRGEHYSVDLKLGRVTGSSPHARGTLHIADLFRRCVRFIPACAGNTGCAPTSTVPRTVHPRMRGEHREDWSLVYDVTGSSPHARGTHYPRLFAELRERFIPACAGNTTRPIIRKAPSPVHPRMRGEHLLSTLAYLAICGSSPHARGTLRVPRNPSAIVRFIPACAGNTIAVITMLDLSAGSSPHARGTQEMQTAGTDPRRFIPACAGNTRDANGRH